MKRRLAFIGALSLCSMIYAQAEKDAPEDSISRVYTLGAVEVIGKTTKASVPDKLDMIQMREFNRDNLTDAVNLIPGLTISETGARNEGAFYLRGFSMLQTPIFYDGVPIYVPYDGNVDITRFTTFDLAQISVSKAFTSVLYGPNTMGGAINLVSRKPAKKLEIDGISGMKFSKEGLNGYNTGINIGSRMKKFYFLGSFSFLDTKFMSLSDKFTPTDYEDGGRREHSAAKDLKISAKVGYTPNATDEYSVSFIIQNAEKNISPSILGGQYRDYPKYDKKSVYFKSNTYLGLATNIKVTAFYDNYYNIMDQFDDKTYLLQNTKKAFHSIYNDYSLGGSFNLSNESIKNNVLQFAFHEKYDSHKEHNGGIAANETTGQTAVTGEPIQKYLDNTISAGLEDTYTFNKYIIAVAGLSYNSRSNSKAQEYGTHYLTGEKNVLYDFPTGSDDAFNYQLATILHVAKGHDITVSASRKSHFASQKDRYSSKFGSQEPNPDLASEFSWIFDITYEGKITDKFQYQASVFRNNVDDAIYQITVGTQDNGDPIYQNRNVGKSVFQGYELSFGWEAMKNLTLGGNYSYIHRENKEDKTVKFVGVPDHKFIAYGKYKLSSWDAYFHFDTEVNSKRYVTSTGTTVPGYMLMNAKIHSQVWKGLACEIGSRNLFDRNYSISQNYPREGRTFFTSVVYNF
ncbi:TonB-dependent receptor plug domain-containing protein [Bacteroides ihuae]|uniref:TonB-dependent receptor plug domain-containing protein n=1 Tax=Bacteroides ihuae TaxID=1852362 RepID=UPI0008DA4F35|nr:TonB-dependent receptor plug domain-containing protein [Bacteroides ihuae]